MKKLSKGIESFNVIRIVMGIVGGLPPMILIKNYPPLWDEIYFMYSIFIIIVFGACFVLTQFVNLLSITDDIELLVDSSYFMFQQTTFCIKAFIVLKNWKQIRLIFFKLQSPELNSHSEDQDYIIQNTMWIIKRNSIVYYSIISIGLIIIFNLPLAFGYRNLILAGWFPYNLNNTANFVLTYAWQEAGFLLCANFNGSMDVLTAALIIFVCGQLNVLSNSLENIRHRAMIRLERKETDLISTKNSRMSEMKNVYETPFDVKLENTIYEEIIYCIRHHYAILNLVEMIEDTFLNMVVVQFTGSVLVLCLTTFEISLLSIDNPNLIGIIIFQSVLLQQLFLYCWYGNELYYTSLTVFDATYMSEWNQSGTKVRQAIAIILDRTKRPILLMAGNILPLTLETFIAIIKLSYSFYTILDRARNDEDF